MGQATVSAPRAQIYYSTSPVFGALWAFLLLQEPITSNELAGGAILLGGLGLVAVVADNGLTAQRGPELSK